PPGWATAVNADEAPAAHVPREKAGAPDGLEAVGMLGYPLAGVLRHDDRDVAERDVFARHLGQAPEEGRRMVRVARRDLTKADPTHARRSLVDGARSSVRDHRVPLRVGVVVEVHREGDEDVSHDDVRRADVLDDAAAAAPGLDADAALGAGEDAVRHDHVAHVPARLAPDDDAAVT